MGLKPFLIRFRFLSDLGFGKGGFINVSAFSKLRSSRDCDVSSFCDWSFVGELGKSFFAFVLAACSVPVSVGSTLSSVFSSKRR